MKNKLLVISDGNGVDNNFKKWPFYLKLLAAKTHVITNKSVVGCSNELAFMQLAEALATEHYDHAIIQWTVPQRLDVILDEFWQAEASKDPVYHFNIIENNGAKRWVSSGSDNVHVKDYHNKFILPQQAVERSQSFMLAAAELLKSHNVDFVFSLCYEFNFISPLDTTLQTYPWVWHQPTLGLSEFRKVSKFSEFDTGLAQPHTLIHLDWINKVLKPQCDFIDYTNESYYNIEQAVIKQCSE